MPDVGKKIVSFLREKGESVDSDQILVNLRLENSEITKGDVTVAVRDLKEMGLVNYEYGVRNSVQVVLVRLK